MQTLDDARKLAELMVNIGRLAGRQTVALISDMNQPLGHAVGNALEVVEAIETLHGGGPPDFREHCLHVSAHMLLLGKRAKDLDEGRRMAEQSIADGSAFEKFRVLVQAQGGDVSFVDNPDKFPEAKFVDVVKAPRSGFISQVHARSVGEASVALGAGRAKKGDPVDHAVGFVIHHKVGDQVEEGQPLFKIHANDAEKSAEARVSVLKAHIFSDIPVSVLPLFYV
jgi:pyrimidine-nucleoside phosphorylase